MLQKHKQKAILFFLACILDILACFMKTLKLPAVFAQFFLYPTIITKFIVFFHIVVEILYIFL